MRIKRRYISGIVLLFLLALTLSASLVKTYGFEQGGRFEYNRARIIGYMLKQNLAAHHFANKHFDPELSAAVVDLYLKTLDSQKRFLLKADADKLMSYTDAIDEEITTGKLELADAGSSILEKRTALVKRFVNEILAGEFDFSTREFIETDPEKMDFCTDENELKERWRKVLKYQVLNQYLSMLEDSAGPASESNKENKDSKKEAATESRPESKNEPKDAPQKNEQVKIAEKAPDKKPDEAALMKSAKEKIVKNYETFFTRTSQEKERERFDRFFSSVARAFDPHTEYMPPAGKEDFDIGMRGTLEGIGATLKEDDIYIKVISIVPGGPAFLQGRLHAEDIILKVAEGANEPVEITNMPVGDAVRLIRGKKGTEVRLTVKKPDGTHEVIPIIRDIVQIEDTFAKGTNIKDEISGKTFGYIKIPTFYRDFEGARHGGTGRNSTDDVRKELYKFESQDISGLVLDLRNNGGGALTDAVKIAGLFIKTGPVVQVKNSNGKIQVLADEEPAVQYSGPMIVLVNKFSASASEILAGALQDYGRAVIVGGDHTHGKGTVQSIVDLNDMTIFGGAERYKPLGALKLTIQKFYRISGASTQYRGVIPDIQLPDRLKGIKSGEQYLDYALKWDTIGPANYSKWADLDDDIKELREKSMRRVAASQDFREIEADSKKVIEQRNKSLYSLNIDDAKTERAEGRSREKEGKSPHGHGKREKREYGKEMTQQDRLDFWLKDLHEDVYVREGLAVLSDMLAIRHAASVN